MKPLNINLLYIGLLSTVGFSLSASLALHQPPKDLALQRWPATATPVTAVANTLPAAPVVSSDRVQVTVDGTKIDAFKSGEGEYTAYIPDPTCLHAKCTFLHEIIDTKSETTDLQTFLQRAIGKIVTDKKEASKAKRPTAISSDCEKDALDCRAEELKELAAACEITDQQKIDKACKADKNKARCETQQEKSTKRTCVQRVNRYFNSQVLRLMRTQLSFGSESEEFHEAELIRDELLADLPESFIAIREGLIDAAKTGVAARTQKNYADLLASGETQSNAAFQAKLKLQEELSMSPFSTAGRLKGAINNYAYLAEDRKLVSRLGQSYQRNFYQPLIDMWMRDLSKGVEDKNQTTPRLGLDLSPENLERERAALEKERGKKLTLPAAFGTTTGRTGTIGAGSTSSVATAKKAPVNRSQRESRQ